jgi:hypothetical protein
LPWLAKYSLEDYVKKNQSQALLYQGILCRTFHNVRLSITGIRWFEIPALKLDHYVTWLGESEAVTEPSSDARINPTFRVSISFAPKQSN